LKDLGDGVSFEEDEYEDEVRQETADYAGELISEKYPLVWHTGRPVLPITNLYTITTTTH
jgi:hypothetical protein